VNTLYLKVLTNTHFSLLQILATLFNGKIIQKMVDKNSSLFLVSTLGCPPIKVLIFRRIATQCSSKSDKFRGLNPPIASAVGNDRLGGLALKSIKQKGLCYRLIQIKFWIPLV